MQIPNQLRFLLIFLCFPIIAEEAEPVPIQPLLTLGPVDIGPGPDWSKSKKANALKANLAAAARQSGLPTADAVQTIFNTDYTWRQADSAQVTDKGVTLVSVNLEVERYLSGSVMVEFDGDVALYLNGASLSGSKDKGFEIKAVTGSHHLTALLWHDGEATAKFMWRSKTEGASFHVKPQHRVSAKQLFETPTVSQLSLSPDGSRLILGTRGRGDDSWESQVGIYDAETGALQRQWTANPPGGFVWSRDGKQLAYRIGKDVWIEHDGQAKRVLEGYDNLGSYAFHPSGGSLFFHWSNEGDKPKNGVKRYRELPDRWRGWRNRTQIYELDIQSGMVRQWTENELSNSLADIHADGTRLLYSQTLIDYTEPPYQQAVLFELDLTTGKATELLRDHAMNGARYDHEGHIVLTGGASFSDGLGSNLPDGVDPNDYDSQLYRRNAETGEITPLSKTFKPTISGYQSLPGGDILILAGVEDGRRLYRYRNASGEFVEIAGPASLVESFTASDSAEPLIFWRGVSPTQPQQVYRRKPGGKAEAFFNAAPDAYAQTTFGDIKDYDVVVDDGTNIDGRVYYPPGFDASKKYPLIVYYYGGTTPVSEAFTGRYPFNLWAANGYIIYVPQPSGAIGYGQEFSARHVNAWGKRTADDIIQSTKKFLEDHSYADSDRIGCAGASYGGFMTMYLQTQTDIFSAAISHAGISQLTGYWGKGNWGYLYNGIAGRGSMPWNNRELYVDQSPIYSADKITTPLLLVTGDADTNVPPEQSHVMYTALKLLGKDVELVTVDNQDHHILNYDQRYVWWDTMLAWFDRYLKDQAEWWDSLYPN